MSVFGQIKSLFKRSKAKAKAAEPKPTAEATKKEGPDTPKKSY